MFIIIFIVVFICVPLSIPHAASAAAIDRRQPEMANPLLAPLAHPAAHHAVGGAAAGVEHLEGGAVAQERAHHPRGRREDAAARQLQPLQQRELPDHAGDELLLLAHVDPRRDADGPQGGRPGGEVGEEAHVGAAAEGLAATRAAVDGGARHPAPPRRAPAVYSSSSPGRALVVVVGEELDAPPQRGLGDGNPPPRRAHLPRAAEDVGVRGPA